MDKKTIREITVASAMYSLGSILGPLLVFGGLGLLLDRFFSTHPWSLLIGVLVAFIFTNILLFKKIRKINKMMASYRKDLLANKEKSVSDIDSNLDSSSDESI